MAIADAIFCPNPNFKLGRWARIKVQNISMNWELYKLWFRM